MIFKILCTIFCFWNVSGYSQTHFTKFKSPNYKIINIISGSLIEDSTKFDVIEFNSVRKLKDLTINLRQVGEDSSKICIYRNNKLIQTFLLPFMFWNLENECMVADLDRNNEPDIRLTIRRGGASLSGELAYKVYLFNQGNRFKLLCFFDFSHEKEYDINKDGIYEILSCNLVHKRGHNYWVYNAFNFTGKKLKNISKLIDYPLWTKYLFSSRNIIATNISRKERIKEYKELPDEIMIK